MAPTIEARVVPIGSKNLSRLSHTLEGSRTSRARIFFGDPSRSAGSENEAHRKGYAVKSAKLERCTQGKGCQLLPKVTDYVQNVEYCLEAEAADYFQK